MHDHSPGGATAISMLFAVPFALGALLYCSGVAVQWRRGRHWPWPRTLAWLAGMGAAGFGVVGPLVSRPLAFAHQGFVAHMWSHLLVGMLAPVLLVIAAPVSLALRSLHIRRARQVSRVLRSRPARLLTLPLLAGAWNIGGIWLLYSTDTYQWMQQSLLLHLAVMTHVLLAGVLFTAVIIPFDPSPHRATFATRLIVLVAAVAAHNILAKLVYASPPGGVTAADGRAGALLMYYGGDIVDAILITILWIQWYRDAGRQLVRAHRGQPPRPAATLSPTEG